MNQKLHRNEELLTRVYEALATGDPGPAYEATAPDATMRVSGTGPLSGTFEGREAIFEQFGEAAQRSGGTMTMTPEAVSANDDTGFALVRLQATRDGRRFDDHFVHVFGFADGKVVSLREFIWDQAQDADFWR